MLNCPLLIDEHFHLISSDRGMNTASSKNRRERRRPHIILSSKYFTGATKDLSTPDVLISPVGLIN